MRPPLPGRVSADCGALPLLFTLFLLFTIATLTLATDLARLNLERARLEQAAATAVRVVMATAVDGDGIVDPEIAVAYARAFARNLESAHPGPRRPRGRLAELVFDRPGAFTVTIRQPLAPDGSPLVCASRMIGIHTLELRASATGRARRRT